MVGYKNEGKRDILLELNPLLNYRDYHGLMHQNPQTDFYNEPEEGCITVHPEYGSDRFILRMMESLSRKRPGSRMFFMKKKPIAVWMHPRICVPLAPFEYI